MVRAVFLKTLGRLLAAMVFVSPAAAQDTRISADRASGDFTLNGTTISITRSTGASCPPACVQPLEISPDIVTLAELEVIAFLEDRVAAGAGLLIDVRPAADFAVASIPGAVNIPAATLTPDNPYRSDLLAALGLDGPESAGAFDLAIFADSAASDLAAGAIRSLRDAGYPADKLHFYRAGLAGWTALGLNTQSGG
ncbi:rhodanese-like domain-containing protein [Thalassococcus sp. BH17M4-6]|uniref:rhodanese-like domain-containing protein n=1 Tax=Thalassococcus sp. BH17M4-6 TaxID=3413148 RepID=UPI003BBFD65F